jgi:hypothetical protein
LERVKLPPLLYEDADLSDYLHRHEEYWVDAPGISKRTNVFVSHYGLVSKWGLLDRYCMPNLFPENDIAHYWRFQKEVALQELVCRYGKSLKYKTLDSDHEYVLIHHKWFGYAFWMTCFFPRLLRVLDSPEIKKRKLLVSKRWINFPYVQDSLKEVEIDLEELELDEHVFVPHLILPHARKASSYFFSPEVKKTRAFFYSKYNLPIANSTPSRKIWIHRPEKSRRAIINEEEVLREVKRFGFDAIVFEDLTLKEQVELLSQTKILAGLHGAGLANAIFLQEGAKLLEFIPNAFAAYGHPFTFRALAYASGLCYGVSGMTAGAIFSWIKGKNLNSKIRLNLINSNQELCLEKVILAFQGITR